MLDKHDIQHELREAYLADDSLFESRQEGQVAVRLDKQQAAAELPAWLNETRFVSFLIGFLGIFLTFLSLGQLAHWIQNGFVLNLVLLLSLSGFANYLIYPYLLKYALVNGLNQYRLLRFLNNYLLFFSTLVFLCLMSWPIIGLGISLIILPVPVATAIATRKFLMVDSSAQLTPPAFNFYSIFDHDLRRLAWISFFTALMALFSILILFGI